MKTIDVYIKQQSIPDPGHISFVGENAQKFQKLYETALACTSGKITYDDQPALLIVLTVNPA